MPKTLYEKLNAVENVNESIRTAIDSIELPVKLNVERQNLEISEEEILNMQRRCFNQYQHNAVLADAVRGDKPLEKSLEEVKNKYGWIRRLLLPRRKNKEYNQKIQELDELIGYTGIRPATGIFMPDNLLTVSAYSTALVFGLVYLSGLSLSNKLSSPEISTGLSALMVPINALILATFSIDDHVKAQAKYIDEKIEKLF